MKQTPRPTLAEQVAELDATASRILTDPDRHTPADVQWATIRNSERETRPAFESRQ